MKIKNLGLKTKSSGPYQKQILKEILIKIIKIITTFNVVITH